MSTKRYLMKNIMIVARCATLYQDEQMAQGGITGFQAPYLNPICSNPGITQDELAQKLHVNRSSVTRQLALLEKNGFVTRKRSENDRRAIEVYPTDKMVDTLPLLREVHMSWRGKLIEGLSEDELKSLEELMTKLAARAEEMI